MGESRWHRSQIRSSDLQPEVHFLGIPRFRSSRPGFKIRGETLHFPVVYLRIAWLAISAHGQWVIRHSLLSFFSGLSHPLAFFLLLSDPGALSSPQWTRVGIDVGVRFGFRVSIGLRVRDWVESSVNIWPICSDSVLLTLWQVTLPRIIRSTDANLYAAGRFKLR